MYPRKSFIVSKTVAVLLGIWICIGFCFCENSEGARKTKKDTLEVRIMSFNIRYGTANDGRNRWPNRRELVFDVIRDHKSDVVGLQEALKFQIDEILDEVPGFKMVGVGRDDGKTQGEYSAILYDSDRFRIGESGTFWLSDTPDVPGSITWGNACTRICTWARLVEKKSGKAFYAFNVHLDHKSQPSRERSAVLLAQRIRSRAQQDPFVVTGDFNVGETNAVVLYLTGRTRLGGGGKREHANPVPMVDTFRVLYPSAGDVGTFNGFKGRRQGEKIDYVFAPSDVEVVETEILHDNIDGRYPSDHFPVNARLRLPTTRKR